ncbi:hypothetical protein LS77_007350 [Helicobacter bilis]|uniref:Uncharacterized protein n=3 Tax=Helicobacter bilis TaxID=37372 RepID=A0A6D2C8Z2_9HELI|nr:hypothetical protein [Helicobacter bilis]EMZ40681.1 hypothetical protein C826_00514 [Helicobacter bilis WiWa]TLE04043.1 hypothetical protein LS77_007350 [Helicobacter bilis]
MSERVDFNIDCHDFDKSKSRNDTNLYVAPCHTEPLGEVSKNTESKRDFSFATQTQSKASLENNKDFNNKKKGQK